MSELGDIEQQVSDVVKKFMGRKESPSYHEVVDIPSNRLDSPKVIRGQNGKIAFGTDEGLRQPPNEDAIVINTPANSFAVIDGMGGHAMGDIAAGILAQEIQNGFRSGTRMEEVQKAAHSRMQRKKVGGACYITAEIQGNLLRLSQAGDVKAVVITKDGRVVFKTHDEDRADYGQSNIVTNSVSGEHPGSTTRSETRVNPGDRIVVASDGLWDNISPIEIATMIAGKPINKAILEINRAAKNRMNSGEHQDNISVVICDFDRVASEEQRLKPAVPDRVVKTKGLPGISTARNFGALFQAIDELGAIKGTRQVYTSDELRRIIKAVRREESPIDAITRAGGLRDKVRELMQDPNGTRDFTEIIKKLNAEEARVQEPERPIVTQEAKPKPTITNAQSVSELFQAIDGFGIPGSAEEYTPNELKELVNLVLNGKLRIHHLPENLRSTVRRLSTRKL